ncbi:MAG: DUF4294 domain-containing protein [Flavobacteriia bacterium]|nr:DUF4294 domain-containing protein [Flavobacteriia bacterium]
MEAKSHNVIIRLLFIACLVSASAFSQIDTAEGKVIEVDYIPTYNDTLIVFKYIKNGEVRTATIIEGDTVRWMVLDEVLLLDKPSFDSEEARRRYFILKRKVMHVYPYAVLAGNRLDSLNLRLDTLTDEDDREDYIEEYNDFLRDRFEPELRKLTRSEGQILCKLIYRETGMSVYDLISDYRSGWTAFWWNVNANWYDISLKQPYLPEEDDEDQLIEQILQRAFQQGLLEERVPFYPPSE